MPTQHPDPVNGETTRLTSRSVRLLPGAQVERWHRLALLGFAVSAAFVLTNALLGTTATVPAFWRWLEGLPFVFAAVLALLNLARRLPAQNLVAVGLVLGGLTCFGEVLALKMELPFCRFEYGEAVIPKVLGAVAWPIPFLWIALLVSSRGVAKLLLRPWRKGRYYGYGLFGATVGLVLLAWFWTEPFLGHAQQYRTWNGGAKFTWYGAPWGSLAAGTLLAAVALAFATPWLLPKRPMKPQVELAPLWTWMLLQSFLLLALALRGAWAATFLGGAIVAAVCAASRWGAAQAVPGAFERSNGGGAASRSGSGEAT